MRRRGDIHLPQARRVARGQSLKKKGGQTISLPPADTKVWSTPSSDCFLPPPLVRSHLCAL